ncbi:hypothetical protein J2S43_005068 [Catenuloplanes nepalensis]|uniref:Uncharacterized protein n=1 Tax=Catenuloplanes nepalensis TaxID=587533 RepID=A0ABT9MYN6_9ACTN|nr:hypothetical protein [Catenuloplanes nepalensis]MDP9796556.1 hypothetical protein [Catenuloplanes nepalensis]
MIDLVCRVDSTVDRTIRSTEEQPPGGPIVGQATGCIVIQKRKFYLFVPNEQMRGSSN